jgi:hypothetical protein
MTDILMKGAMETPYHKQRGTSKPVAKMKDGVVLKVYNSINEAARDNNIYSSNISDVVHGFHSQTHGYQWKYLDYNMPKGLRKKQNKKKVELALKPCKVVLEKDFPTSYQAKDFIKEKSLTDAKIIITRNRKKGEK